MNKDHPLFKQLGKSDDLLRHESVFIYAYQSMVNDQLATPEDFEKHGGWVSSMTRRDLYYVFVGTATNVFDRYYLDARNGQITKGQPNV